MSRQAELKLIDVVVGVLTDDDGRVLIQQRTDGPFAGQWEFPGGKREPGESYFDALARELLEENGVQVATAAPLIQITHEYADRAVSLNTFIVGSYSGFPSGAEGQNVRWVSPRGLFGEDMLPADRALTVAINLPQHYLITPPLRPDVSEATFLDELDASLAHGTRLVCLRPVHVQGDAYERLARLVAARCERTKASLMLHGGAELAPLVREVGAQGLHMPSRYARALGGRPLDADLWFAVSTHTSDDLAHAQMLQADFATVGSVQSTTSHPDGPTLGWARFAELVCPAGLPVYGIGGLNRADAGVAREHGGQGIAAIRGLWAQTP